MTQVASTVTVPFTANVGGFMGGMKSAMGALQKFQVTTGKTSGSLGKMGAALGVVSAGLAGLKVAQQSVETFKKFESAMTRVQAVSRANNKEMELLSEKTSQVASATTFTATEVAEGMGFMAMAGMEVSTILDSVADAANLAQAAQMGMAEASDIVTNIMMSSSDYKHLWLRAARARLRLQARSEPPARCASGAPASTAKEPPPGDPGRPPGQALGRPRGLAPAAAAACDPRRWGLAGGALEGADGGLLLHDCARAVGHPLCALPGTAGPPAGLGSVSSATGSQTETCRRAQPSSSASPSSPRS